MKLSEAVSSYIDYKRALGSRFRTEQAVLRSFCKTTDDIPLDSISAEALLAFINDKDQVTAYWYKKYHVLSGLYRFAMARAWVKASPLPRSLPKPTVPPFIPYIYTHAELNRLLDAVPAVCSGRTPVEAPPYRMLLLLLYGAGLRLGEALALTLADVDLEQACLRIHLSKFFKSRLVPLGKDLTTALTTYLVNYREGRKPEVAAPLLCFRDGTRLSQSAVRNVFRRLRQSAGVRREGGTRRQPRLHDLRHTAAVHRLTAWYRSGADVNALLPKLATYLGHVDLSATQHYLTLTPELLQQASLRFERYATGDCHHD